MGGCSIHQTVRKHGVYNVSKFKRDCFITFGDIEVVFITITFLAITTKFLCLSFDSHTEQPSLSIMEPIFSHVKIT